jgi:hypothetical protein
MEDVNDDIDVVEKDPPPRLESLRVPGLIRRDSRSPSSTASAIART